MLNFLIITLAAALASASHPLLGDDSLLFEKLERLFVVNVSFAVLVFLLVFRLPQLELRLLLELLPEREGIGDLGDMMKMPGVRDL